MMYGDYATDREAHMAGRCAEGNSQRSDSFREVAGETQNADGPKVCSHRRELGAE